MGKSNTTLYIVRSEHSQDTMFVFNSRPVLVSNMTDVTGKEWVLETIHYHLTKRKKTEFSKDGWRISFHELDESILGEEYVYLFTDDTGSIGTICVGMQSLLAEVARRGLVIKNMLDLDKSFNSNDEVDLDGNKIYRRRIIR